ncbi:MAG: hypothetical protein M8353_01460 [ANME-2 cluster archaeon]|nr:hypothetical protein [ANME-2 cluster archaeon]
MKIMKLAEYLDQMRLRLVYGENNKKNAKFVIEDLNRETAEVFTKLQLGRYIPN